MHLFLSLLLITASSASPHFDFDALEKRQFLVGRKQIPYDSKQLTQEAFLRLSRLSDTQHLRESVNRILIPRVVGTEGHRNVRNYIANSLRALDWNVELNKFHDNVPILGERHFCNVIAKLNPQAERYLTLACHYDSKYMPDIHFVGAIDSAMPCAILLNLAHVLQAELNAYRTTDLSLMLIFFDGEEAFENWSPSDSLYGSRHLARKWEKDNFIDRLDMLVLLDLIGAPDPKFYNFFKKTESWYTRLIEIENRLSNAGLLGHYTSGGIARKEHSNHYFHSKSLASQPIEDDHKPFLDLGVPALHIIPLPYPNVWHTEKDNESALDFATSENIARIIRIFTLQYLLAMFNKSKVAEEI